MALICCQYVNNRPKCHKNFVNILICCIIKFQRFLLSRTYQMMTWRKIGIFLLHFWIRKKHAQKNQFNIGTYTSVARPIFVRKFLTPPTYLPKTAPNLYDSLHFHYLCLFCNNFVFEYFQLHPWFLLTEKSKQRVAIVRQQHWQKWKHIIPLMICICV